jgi:26S proteasome regulatory subunit N12|tara:strand:+ start:367 stop:1230 length:864 start_codon:yes stop_codon:yes gene_type:complete
MTRPEDLASAQNSFKEFKKAFEQATASSSSSSSKDESSFQTAFNLLENLKVALTHLTALPPLFEQTKSKKEELLLARELLEMSVILCARADDEMSFERNFAQLKSYYEDVREDLPPSQNEPICWGLNLLRLLMQNRIGSFHAELELTSSELLANACVKYSIELEQRLMDGAYNKIVEESVNGEIPDESFKPFANRMSKTARDEIVNCIEKSASEITLNNLARLLILDHDKNEAMKYAMERGWNLDASRLEETFVFSDAQVVPSSKDIPSNEMISRALLYSRELERIV